MPHAVIHPPRRMVSSNNAVTVRTHRIINLRLLLVSVTGLVVIAACGYFWYSNQFRHLARTFEQRASMLEAEGDWAGAAAYLRRYLRVAPHDLEARVRLIAAVEQSIETNVQRRRLLGLLYETLGLAPDRYDLRLKLAHQLLQSADFAGAEEEARKLEAEAGEALQRDARRIVALSLHGRARPGGIISIERAATALAAALTEDPANVALATATAQLYREYPDLVAVADAPAQADEIMDRLVGADPQNAEALVARYSYRRRYAASETARQDLDRILEQDPDHVEALLLLANEELSVASEQQRAAAERRLRRVMELRPNDPRSYIGLARRYAVEGDAEQARNVLSSGRSQLHGPSFELDVLLSGLLIDADELEPADEIIASADEAYRSLMPELASVDRLKLENVLRLLRGRLHLGRKEFPAAAREFEAVIASVGRADATAGAKEHLHAHAMLAEVMAKQGRLDLAAAHWKTIADQAPEYGEARRNAGAAYLELGRAADAIRELEAYVQLPAASPEASILLVQAHLQQQLRLAPEQRNWSEFRLALAEAKARVPRRWELALAEVAYLRTLPNDDANQQALLILRGLETRFVDDLALWEKLALQYQLLNAPADSERALAHYEQLEPSKARQALLRSSLWVQQGRTAEASELLAAAAADASPDDRSELQAARVRLAIASGQLDEAQHLAGERIGSHPQHRALLTLGLDVALAREDYETARQWEKLLKQQDPANDFEWRTYRARRLIAQFANLDRAERAELESMIESLRSERPDWFPVVTLAGHLASLKGDRRQAIQHYRLAIELGDARPEVFQRLVTALYEEGHHAEAIDYLSRLGEAQAADSRFGPLAIALAVKENRLAAALDIAEQALARDPANAVHHVWVANLLSLSGREAEADRMFRDCLEKFPEDHRVWNALFSYLVRSKQPERARRALDKWSQQVKEPRAKHFVLAQGYELLGDVAAAQEQYKAAIAVDSRNVNARLGLARLLMRSDLAAATSQFEDIVKIDPKNVEAKRYLSALLAASGSEEDWTRASQLLQTGEQAGDADQAGADDRLRAILLARRGRNRAERLKNCEAARQILSARLAHADGSGQDVDRLLLAAIYDQESLMRNETSLVHAARDVLRPLVDRESPTAEHLITYIQLLLRHLERWRDEGQQSDEVDAHRVVLIDDAVRRVDQLQSVTGGTASIDSRIMAAALRVRLLALDGRSQDGLQILMEFVQQQLGNLQRDADRSKILLEAGNLATLLGDHQQAEEWYRQLAAIVPNSYVLLAKSLIDQQKVEAAIEVCLEAATDRSPAEAATVLAQLLATLGDSQYSVDPRAQSLIDRGLASAGNNAELLMSVAISHVIQHNEDEAIRLFRQVLKLQPNHPLALNNLATLLAERPQQLAEARRNIERAMTVTGRSPALLDTLGTILTRIGKHDEAILALEEAVAGTARDPRYYFHLAVAYQRAERRPEARESLRIARTLGLDRAILTSTDKDELASLDHELLTYQN